MNFESQNFGTPADKPTDREEKQRQWEAKLAQLRTVADYEGQPIDSGIIETVAAFNVNEFNTVQSCEGHLDEGIPVPWVAVESPDEPAEHFVGEGEIYAEVAQKYNLSVDDLIHAHNMEALQEANDRVMKNPETPQFAEWQRQNLELKRRMEKYLAEFYQNRKVSPEVQLVIDANRYHGFKLHNGGADFNLVSAKLTEEERAQVAPRLRQYQTEMNEFKEFLKRKYFGE